MRKSGQWLLFCFLLVVLVACQENPKSTKKEENDTTIEERKPTEGITFTDSLRNTVTVHSTKRVGICSGSLAHMWQLAGGSLAAVTSDVYTFPAVTLPPDTLDLGDLKRVNVESILASRLDFLILSATIKGHVKVQNVLEQAGITTAYFEVESFKDYLKVLSIMTSLTGRRDLYELYGLQVQEEVARQLKRKKASHPRILLLRALTTKVKVQDSNCMTGRMLKDLGCSNIADSKQSLLHDLNLEAILKEDPECIFITVMGDEEQATQLIEKTIYKDPAWGKLSAIKEKKCYILPKELFHYKPNQRWGESYRMLADLLYDEE